VTTKALYSRDSWAYKRVRSHRPHRQRERTADECEIRSDRTWNRPTHSRRARTGATPRAKMTTGGGTRSSSSKSRPVALELVRSDARTGIRIGQSDARHRSGLSHSGLDPVFTPLAGASTGFFGDVETTHHRFPRMALAHTPGATRGARDQCQYELYGCALPLSTADGHARGSPPPPLSAWGPRRGVWGSIGNFRCVRLTPGAAPRGT